MIRVKGTWSARVDRQAFEIEVETPEEIDAAIAEQMRPQNAIELHDFEHDIEEIEVVE